MLLATMSRPVLTTDTIASSVMVRPSAAVPAGFVATDGYGRRLRIRVVSGMRHCVSLGPSRHPTGSGIPLLWGLAAPATGTSDCSFPVRCHCCAHASDGRC